MACYINIENRYRCASLRERQMHHVWAATAAAVVSVGATAVSAGMQASASSKAAKAQGAAAKKATRQEKKALRGFTQGQQQIEADLGKVPMPVFNLPQDIAGARDISAYYRQEQEKFLPGAAAQREKGTQQLNQAMDVIGTYLRGEIPQDVKDQLMRNIAEMGGAGFAPAAAGRGAFVQGPQANLARSLGLTSLDIQGRGLTAAPQIQASAQRWNELAERFRAEPLDVSRMSLAYQMGGADVGLKKAGIRSDLLAAQYGAQLGQTERGLARQQEQAATSLALEQQRAATLGKMGESVASGVSSVGNAYSQYANAKGASTTPMASGFYAGEIGAANAYGVAPSQLSYQKGTGGFLGIGGQGGGYYYTPGGVYGRT